MFIVGVALSSSNTRPHAERPTSVPAPNPATERQALTIQVREAGMQRISGAALAHLGASRIGFDPAQLQLHRDGQEVTLQLLGAEDGHINVGDELRFYASDPGDRWNTTDTYWPTYEDHPGQRIERRDSGLGTAPQRTIGDEAGIWQPRTSYDSTVPGPDGDHRLADNLHSGPEQEIDTETTVSLTTRNHAMFLAMWRDRQNLVESYTGGFMNNRHQGLPAQSLANLEKQKQKLEAELEQVRNEHRDHLENNGKAWKDSFNEDANIRESRLLEEIAKIESTIANASIQIHSYNYYSYWNKPLVKIGDTVTIQHEDDNELETYYIAGEGDSHVQQKIISCNSPLGKCLLDPYGGKRRTYSVNNTKYTITIIKVNDSCINDLTKS